MMDAALLFLGLGTLLLGLCTSGFALWLAWEQHKSNRIKDEAMTMYKEALKSGAGIYVVGGSHDHGGH